MELFAVHRLPWTSWWFCCYISIDECYPIPVHTLRRARGIATTWDKLRMRSEIGQNVSPGGICRSLFSASSYHMTNGIPMDCYSWEEIRSESIYLPNEVNTFYLEEEMCSEMVECEANGGIRWNELIRDTTWREWNEDSACELLFTHRWSQLYSNVFPLSVYVFRLPLLFQLKRASEREGRSVIEFCESLRSYCGPSKYMLESRECR